MENDSVSTVDDRQPYHIIDGKVLTQREWRDKVRDAERLLEAFKRSAFKEKEL